MSLFELCYPLLRKTFVGGIIAPRMQIIAVEEVHRDIGVFHFVIDVCPVVDRDEAAKSFQIDDICEISQLELKAGVGTVTQLVRFVAIQIEQLDDNAGVLGTENRGFSGLLEYLREAEPAESR